MSSFEGKKVARSKTEMVVDERLELLHFSLALNKEQSHTQSASRAGELRARGGQSTEHRAQSTQFNHQFSCYKDYFVLLCV